MSFHAAEWVGPAARVLFEPMVEELNGLPGWAAGEPEWELLGLIRSDVVRRARAACVAEFGIHGYTRLVRAAILDPEVLAPMVEGAGCDRSCAPPPPGESGNRDYPLAMLGAAFLQARRKLSDLPLFLDYLSGCRGMDLEDLYDLTSLWGHVDDRIDALFDICRNGSPRVVEMALLSLAAPGMRPFVDAHLTELYRLLSVRELPGVLAAFHEAFYETG